MSEIEYEYKCKETGEVLYAYEKSDYWTASWAPGKRFWLVGVRQRNQGVKQMTEPTKPRYHYYDLLWKDSYSDKMQERHPTDQEAKDTEWTVYVQLSAANEHADALEQRVKTYDNLAQEYFRQVEHLKTELEKSLMEKSSLESTNAELTRKLAKAVEQRNEYYELFYDSTAGIDRLDAELNGDK